MLNIMEALWIMMLNYIYLQLSVIQLLCIWLFLILCNLIATIMYTEVYSAMTAIRPPH